MLSAGDVVRQMEASNEMQGQELELRLSFTGSHGSACQEIAKSGRSGDES